MLRDMWAEWYAWLGKSLDQEYTTSSTPDAATAPSSVSHRPASRYAGPILIGPSGDHTDDDPKSLADRQAIQALLTAYDTTQLEVGLWDMAKMEDPDGLLCRFLRARKWKLLPAMAMFAGALKWRLDSDLEVRRSFCFPYFASIRAEDCMLDIACQTRQ